MKEWTRPSLLAIIILHLGMVPANGQIKARFTSNTVSGCAPLVVRFTDESEGTPTSWRWDLGNGTVSFLQNPANTYFAPGTYTVKLTVRKENQVDSIVKEKYITVFASPVVAFAASETSGCFPKTIYFNDISNPGDGVITKWEWDFGDGSNATGQHPQHVYESGGLFNVSLRIHNSNGCIRTLTRQNYIRLSQGVKADFISGNSANCKPPSPIQFTNTSVGTGPLTYKWLFGDGNTSTDKNPTHTYTAAGTYRVTLITGNTAGCTDSITGTNPIKIGNVKADFLLPDLICAGVQVPFTNASDPDAVSATWDFGDNTSSDLISPVKIYNTPGTYTVKLLTNFGSCIDSIRKTIVVLPKPRAAFTANNTASCKAPLTTQFKLDFPSNAQVTWFFGDGDSSTDISPVHTYTREGEFDVIVSVRNASGCQETIVKPKYIRVRLPLVTVTNLRQEGCIPLRFTPELFVEYPDTLQRYEWSWGDGTTSSDPKPQKIYDIPGSYNIKLNYSTKTGCSDSIFIKDAVKVGQPPLSNFIAEPRSGCAFNEIQYKDKSAGAPADRWAWSFGDGGSSYEQNPVHRYTDTGYFDVTLIAWNNGCFDSIRIPRYIQIKPPIAKFLDSSSCSSPLKRWFNDLSIGGTGWLWKFGDGTESREQNPVHVYQSGGSYEVSLTVTNDTCEHTFKKQIQIVGEKITFSSDSTACKGGMVQFEANRSPNIVNYKWDFGDGIIENGSPAPGHVYSENGEYTVTLVTTDLYGCTDSISLPAYIKITGPTASFTASSTPVCTNSVITFKDSSYTDNPTGIIQWVWNFGDGEIDTVRTGSISHLYQKGGNHTVSLTVKDETGCSHTNTQSALITISDPSAAFLSFDTLSCTGKPVNFSNESSGNALSYEWKFSNTLSSENNHPSITFSEEGDYSVSLKISDPYGCKDSITKSNYIRIRDPRSIFTISDSVGTCPPLVVDFKNASTNLVRWEWDFGDGTKSTLADPFHFYSYPGIYESKLHVTGYGGCVSTLTKTITVRGPQGTFTYDKFSGCEPTEISFTGKTKDEATFIWDFNDGSIEETPNANITHTYTLRGSFVPKMILVDPQGCQVPIQSPDTIHIYGVNPDFTSLQKNVCDSGVVRFTNKSYGNEGISQYQWKFGDGKISTEVSPVHSFQTGGTYPVELTTTTVSGCTAAKTYNIPVLISQTPITTIKGDTSACTPAKLALKGEVIAQDTSVLFWNWDFGNSEKSNQQNPEAVTYQQSGKYTVTMISRNSFGCADTTLQVVQAFPLPSTFAGPDVVICEGKSTDLRVTGGSSYHWTPSQTLSCSDCSSPQASPLVETKYYVAGKNEYGCILADSVIVGVQHPLQVEVSPADTICIGESVILSAKGVDSYVWSPAQTLNNAGIASPVAKPSQSTVYRVIGSDKLHCFKDTAYIPVIVYPYPKVNAGPDQHISVGSSLHLKPSMSPDVKKLVWMPPAGLNCATCPDPVATPKENITYTIEVMNEGGCKTSDQINVTVFCSNSNLFLPNTFSPNYDGNNDIFYPRGSGIFSIKTFRVFNRWGEMIFENTDLAANDASKGWNGMHKSKPAPQDVYVYSVDVLCENKVVLNFKGNVVLIR